MKSICLFGAFVIVMALAAPTTPAFAQSYNPDPHTQGTTLGQSHNTPQDLANSLVVNNKPKIGKEKKEEVDPKKLVSKKSTDTTFSGGLNDVNLDWTANTMGKPHGASADDSKAAKSDTAGKKDLKAAKSSEGSAEIQTKEEKTTAKSDDKSAEKQADKEKAKTDSDR